MRRRDTCILIGGATLVWQHVARAQQPQKIPRVGFLTAVPLAVIRLRTEAFQQGLRELGYVEGRNIVIEWRSADGQQDSLPALVAELMRLRVDVIVSAGTAATRPARDATTTIPIVMTQENDPVASGFVASLARPGGNITGLSTLSAELHGKQLELLKQPVPGLARVAVLGSSTDPGNARSQREMEAAARTLSVRLQYLDVLAPGDLEAAFLAMGKERAGAVLALPTFVLADLGTQLADLGLKSRLPVMGFARQSATQGSLMFYGASTVDLAKRAASSLDKAKHGMCRLSGVDCMPESAGAPSCRDRCTEPPARSIGAGALAVAQGRGRMNRRAAVTPINRRAACGAVAALLTPLSSSNAQPLGRKVLVGFLGGTVASTGTLLQLGPLRQGLRELVMSKDSTMQSSPAGPRASRRACRPCWRN